MDQQNPLGVKKIPALLMEFSIPAMVGMIVNSLYNVVDRIFVGNSPDLGTLGLAGITICFPLMMFLMSISILFGMGGATLFSIKLGEQKADEAQKALGNSFTMLLITGSVITIVGQIYLEPILTLFGASSAVLPYAMEYMRIIFLGTLFKILSLGMNNFIRADGSPRIAMMTMFLGAGTNIILDPLFIYVFKMGMTGAALATVIAQSFSLIWVVSYFIGKHSSIKLRLENMKPRLKIVSSIISLGIPACFRMISNSLLNVIINNGMATYGGDIAVSGMGIINSLRSLLLMPVAGLRQGSQPIISFNYGAKKYTRVKTATKLAIAVATVISVAGFIAIRLFPKQLVSIFNQEPELISFGTPALLIWFLFLPVIGFQIISTSYFQAIGKPKYAMILDITRQLIVFIPALLIFPRFWGVDGVLYARPFSDIISFILAAIMISISIKLLGKEALEFTPESSPSSEKKTITSKSN